MNIKGPQGAIGSESSQNSGDQDDQVFNVLWSNLYGGGAAHVPPRKAALKTTNLKQNSSEKINAEGPETKEEMYRNSNESKKRHQAPIGSERAARRAAMKNLESGYNLGLANLDFNLQQGDFWSTSSGGEEAPPVPPRVLGAMFSERAARLAALENAADANPILNLPQGDTWSTSSGGNEAPAPPIGASGSERARLAAMKDLEPGSSEDHANLDFNLPQGDRWSTSSGGADAPPAPPPRKLAPIGSERAARRAAMKNTEPKRESSPIPPPPPNDDDDLSFCVNPSAHWYYPNALPGWEKDPLNEVHPRPGQTFTVFPPEELAAQDLASQFESMHHQQRPPHPDSDPQPTPTPREFDDLSQETPVQDDSSWQSMPTFSGYGDHVLDDIQCVQDKNRRLTERILRRLPNEESRQEFQQELMCRHLRSEQQITYFLEGKLAQEPSEPEPQCWMPWFGNEDE